MRLETPLAPWLQPTLDSLLAAQGHACLVEGAAGLGQFDLAVHAAAAWLCEASPAERAGGLACGRCDGCRAVASHTHHDLKVLVPEAMGMDLGVPLPPKAQEAIDKGERKPSKQIRIDAVLDLVDFVQQTSARGQGKVAVVYPAERMNDVAANALLKVLEEPPGPMRFILVCETSAGVLPTISSRCQPLHLTPPQPAAAGAWLTELPSAAADATTASVAAGLLSASGGLPLRAVAWAQAGMTAERWAALPAQLAGRGPLNGAELLAGLSLAQAVEIMQKLCHDLSVVACGAAPRFFSERDLMPVPKAVSSANGMAALQTWWADLSLQARHVEHPVVATLALDALVVRARRALHSAAA
jgi:DNA polymerase-3 subunit delta'